MPFAVFVLGYASLRIPGYQLERHSDSKFGAEFALRITGGA
ncbi:hypothetical protein [Sporisorium scitamineum]|uniref:Uncharacterized protein n=1 Tax=Sporisorium scitamineum TaxID=49012 RepID=A0A0F7S9B0_9BASI|nr:hypothetical protein [Sporisorium scitamineum]